MFSCSQVPNPLKIQGNLFSISIKFLNSFQPFIWEVPHIGFVKGCLPKSLIGNQVQAMDPVTTLSPHLVTQPRGKQHNFPQIIEEAYI